MVFSEASVTLGDAPSWCWTSMSKLALNARKQVQKCDSRYHSPLHEAKGLLLWWTGGKENWATSSVSVWILSLFPAILMSGFCSTLCDFTGLVKCTYSNLKICMFPSVPWGYLKRGDSETGGRKVSWILQTFSFKCFFFILEWHLWITYTIRYNLMHYTIKSICCSLCISIPMLSLSIFPSLRFRAVEVLSCDITPCRGKSEQPCTLFYTTGKQSEDLLWS